MRVFFVEPSQRLDVTSASEHGDITYIFEANERRPSVFDQESYIDRVKAKLISLDFKPEEDYFVISGPLLNVFGTTMAIVSYLNVHWECAILKTLAYDARSGKYVSLRNLNIGEMLTSE